MNGQKPMGFLLKFRKFWDKINCMRFTFKKCKNLGVLHKYLEERQRTDSKRNTFIKFHLHTTNLNLTPAL